ncbi:Uncharacterised protein [Mycobacteroides abscessus subsp. abscessus]|nr:Uncharacterised protein [Mycobacteroides abscessus subsp. abscessus]
MAPPINNDKPVMSSSRPPAPCSAGTPICRYARIACPPIANIEITVNDTAGACHAAR